MADTQAQRLQKITQDWERTYQALRRAALNISGLLQVGRATCAEVKAYNVWAMRVYQTQVGMLGALRAGGEDPSKLPAYPSQPTLFPWKGKPGQEALNFDCGGDGSFADAIANKEPIYLSTNEIEISTQDVNAFNPEATPSYNALLEAQVANQQAIDAGLGVAMITWIVIAAVTISVSVAIASIMKYLEASNLQEANVEQVRLQAEAFATATNARLICYQDCTSRGGSAEGCTAQCVKLIKEPALMLPGTQGKWGALQWIGFTTVATFGVWATYRLYQRKQERGYLIPPIDFSLPSGDAT